MAGGEQINVMKVVQCEGAVVLQLKKFFTCLRQAGAILYALCPML